MSALFLPAKQVGGGGVVFEGFVEIGVGGGGYVRGPWRWGNGGSM